MLWSRFLMFLGVVIFMAAAASSPRSRTVQANGGGFIDPSGKPTAARDCGMEIDPNGCPTSANAFGGDEGAGFDPNG